MADSTQYTVGPTTDNKGKFNTLNGLIAAFAKIPYALSFDQDCPKALIDQIVNWLVQNPAKWPTNQINFLCTDDPAYNQPNYTYNKYDARQWRSKLTAVKPSGWESRETYSGPHGMFASNNLFKS